MVKKKKKKIPGKKSKRGQTKTQSETKYKVKKQK